MVPLPYLLCVLYLYTKASYGEIVMTQTPKYISVSPGEKVQINCKSSSDVAASDGDSLIRWFQKKADQPPKRLIYWATKRQSGVPERFSGSRSGSPYDYFTLTISGALAEDEAEYYCMQSKSYPYTFGGGTHVEIKRGENVRPTVSIYCPSLEQRNSGSASTVCLVDKFYPGGAQVTWKGDNKVISSGVDTSDKIKDKDNTYSMSSTLTMSSEEFKKYSTMTCEVTHPTLTPALAKSFQTSECTF